MYAREIDGRLLTFSVSGMLWNRSLVMMDIETESLWSQLLGRCMQGVLEGTELRMLPSTMTTWETWRQQYPHTTVLDLPRTHDEYTAEFYRDPKQFVLGWMQGGQAYHCSFSLLQERPLLNLEEQDVPLVLTFDPEGTGGHLYSRRVGDQTLDFEPVGQDQMRDTQTGSLWSQNSGQAISGLLAGQQLEPQVVIVSYARAWNMFHPNSRPVGVD